MVDKIVSWALMGILVLAWYWVGSQVAYFAPAEDAMSMGGLTAGWWFWSLATIAFMRS